jgi:hypothetical protein
LKRSHPHGACRGRNPHLARPQVTLDTDLAPLYGATTERLTDQVFRSSVRFPGDRTFQVTWQESSTLRLRLATSERPD